MEDSTGGATELLTFDQGAPVRAPAQSRRAPTKAIVLASALSKPLWGRLTNACWAQLAVSAVTPLSTSWGREGKQAIDRGMTVAWSTPMAAHAVDAPLIAERIADALFEEVAGHEAMRVTVVHATPTAPSDYEIVMGSLVHFDLARGAALRWSYPFKGSNGLPIEQDQPSIVDRDLVETGVLSSTRFRLGEDSWS